MINCSWDVASDIGREQEPSFFFFFNERKCLHLGHTTITDNKFESKGSRNIWRVQKILV